MKIAHLMGSLNRGGAETLALDMFRNSAHAGLNMILIHRKGGTLAADFRNSGVETIELVLKSPVDVSYLFRLRKKIKDKKITILHAHQVIDAVYAILATVGMPARVILSLHGHGVADDKLSAALRRLAITYADRVIFVSKSQREHYLRRFGDIRKSLVCFNGLDFSKFNVKPDQSLRKELGIPMDYLLMGSVGNFSSGRDQQTICRFLTLLKREAIPFHFVFIGAASKSEPEFFQQCVDYCQTHGLSQQVTFMGSRSDVPAILPALDAFIYSTAHDTFGIAVVEAIASGTPVFVNDWEVMKEVTQEGNWATLYTSRDESDLLKKFIDFYQNQIKYRERAQQNSLAVKENYSIQKYLQRLSTIYTSLLNT
ncbi:glycosyltransferase family 4 protein [Spirosoma panaciterrae]|uniref:glycosyltransferase family 4 protein n=1 Tax=Spirosoma panaciterrae TaxID=496058 RepID=UPI000369DE60|nr:glycosyltransferase family 4 protein [Spirosoma panaciterrae]